ncbi:MAG: FAD:protein FMN transferase [Bacilli bacterium]|nr:FAD:protein FMN transferase [Bacilli bacterium]
MKDKYSKIVISIIGILILIIISLLIYKNNEVQEYSKTFFYMDTYISVKVYVPNEKKANDAFEEIDRIYRDYHNLTNKYEETDYGLYELNKEGNTTIDYRLYEMIKYGYSWYEKSDGLLNIAIGNVTDIWKKYREDETGVPTLSELNKVNIDINNVLINEINSKDKVSDGVILSDGVTIDLGAISKGYTTQIVGDYLKSIGIKKYIINAGGNVLVGDYYKGNSKYKIGIQNPYSDTNPNAPSIFKVIRGNNIAVVTSGGYNRNYVYEGNIYGHIIDPNTRYPADNMASVTVISKSSKDADALSTILYLMDVDTGMEFVKDYDVEVIWYLKDGTIKTTDGISKYE